MEQVIMTVITKKVKELYSKALEFSQLSPGYLFGGGHTRPLSQIRATEFLDCSSSVSRLLYLTGFWDGASWARVSGGFADWGVPGKGKYFTVWYSPTHVWIQFHGLGKYWRFDTSPWGFGRRGAHVRRTPRPTVGFKPRHWPSY